MKIVKKAMLTVMVCLLCSCGQQEEEEPGWIIQENKEENWKVSDSIEISGDIDTRHVVCKQDLWLYLDDSESDCQLHVFPYEDQGEEVHIVLNYPEAENVESSYLRMIYSGNQKESSFLALWEVNSAIDRENFFELIKYDVSGNVLNIVNFNELEMKVDISEIEDIYNKDDCYYILEKGMLTAIMPRDQVKRTELEDERCTIFSSQNNLFFVQYFDDKTVVSLISEGVLTKDICEIPVSGDLFLDGEKEEIFLSEGNKFFRCDMESNHAELVLEWTDIGLNCNNIRKIVNAGNDKFFVLGYENIGPVIWMIESVEYVDNRKEVTMLTTNDSYWWLLERVNEFNKSNENYKIVLKNPRNGMISEEESWEDVQTRIQLLLTSSNPPDLVDLSSVDRWREYSKNGMFEDLQPFLENGDVIDEVDYLPGILAGGRVAGRQVSIPYAYIFTMFFGKEEYLGSDRGWTLQELLDTGKTHENISMLDDNPSNSLSYLLSLSKDEFIDLSNAECDFENQLFYDLLQCAAECKQTEGSRYKFYDNIIEETTLLETAPIVNMEFYLGYTGMVPGNTSGSEVKLALKGYPSKDGRSKGYASLRQGTYFAICSNSVNKEGAWQFIEYLHTYKDDFNSSFPARTDWLRERIQVISPDGCAGVELRDCTENDIENFLDLVECLEFQTNQDETILRIIDEEAQDYFRGQKSKEDVAANIQTRVQLYLWENR